MKSVPEEKLAAESFVSNFPRFVRIMKKFNVSGSYTLVSSFACFILLQSHPFLSHLVCSFFVKCLIYGQKHCLST